MDRTLKSMLTRWAKDSKRTLSYLHSSDFTLYRDVADIRTTDLEDAVSRLTSAYSAEGVSITNDDQIGRASCREIVCRYVSISVVAVTIKKKKSKQIKEE